MWTSNDELWLTVAKNTESTLQVALGISPLRIKASDAEDDNDREGYIDVKIISIKRESKHVMSAQVVANTTGLRLNKQVLTLILDEHVETEICAIKEIDGIIF